MRFKENQLIAEAYAKVYEAKKKPSAGLTKKQKSDVAKKARAGKDIGKKGPGFAKMAKAAGGGEKGKKIAAAAMWKSIKRESADILTAYEDETLLNEDVNEDAFLSAEFAIQDAAKKLAMMDVHPRGVDGKSVNSYTATDVLQSLIQARQYIRALYNEPNVDEDSVGTAEIEVMQVAETLADISKKSDNLKKLGNARELINKASSGMSESSAPNSLDESDPMIPKVEKIIQKMTEEYGSEERAIEELSKWDEDDMNEYYNNHIMSEEAEEE